MRTFGALVVLLMVSGCGGGTPAAESPADESKATADADAKEGGAEEGAEASSSDEPAESEEPAEKESEPEPKKEAKRLLTEEGTSFLYDFTKSEAGEKAKERCDKSSGDDAEKNAKCMSKATKAVKPQGFKFEPDKETEDGWLFVRFEINGNRPKETNRVKAEFADDTGNKVTIKTQGPDKVRGGKPVPASFEIEVPDQYTLIINEPARGKSVYEPKLGLFDVEKR